jgi:hypothetical protein
MNYRSGDIIDVYKVVKPVTRDSVSAKGEAWVWREYLSAHTLLSERWRVRYEPDTWVESDTGLFAFIHKRSAIHFAVQMAYTQKSTLAIWWAKGRFLREISDVVASPTDIQLSAFWSKAPEEKRPWEWPHVTFQPAPLGSILCSGIKLVERVGETANNKWVEYKESEL